MRLELAVYGTGILARTTRNICSGYCDLRLLPTAQTHIAWMCEDTPLVKGQDNIDVVFQAILDDMVHVPTSTLVVISSQLPVGTIARLERAWPHHTFACIPENIRTAHALDDFERQARIVIGYRGKRSEDKALLTALCAPLSNCLIFTDPETAELSKHALNAFLALQIAFINEIGCIAQKVGADTEALSLALLTERRVSPNAPLHVGPPFSTGHLERDLDALLLRAYAEGLSTPLLAAVLPSNRQLINSAIY